MKFLIVLVAVFAVAYCDTTCTTSTHPNIDDELKDIRKLIPTETIREISITRVYNDTQVQDVLKYLISDEFEGIVKTVKSEKLVIDLFSYLCSNGIPIYSYLKTATDLLELPVFEPPNVRSSPGARNFHNFLLEVEAALPLTEMKKVFEDKRKTSIIFKDFYDKISSAEFRTMVRNIWALKSVQDAKAKLVAEKIDVNKLVQLFQELNGWVPAN